MPARLICWIACLCLILSGCSWPPEKITWELRKGSTPADIGWHPKNRTDIMYTHDGDIDFTLIAHAADGSRTAVFHERCWSIGAGRNGVPPNDNVINFVYAHFARDVTVEEGLQIARKVLTDWGGGVETDLPKGELTIEQFADAVKNGKFYEEQWGVQGRDSGVIILTFRGDPREMGLKRKCTLTFRPS